MRRDITIVDSLINEEAPPYLVAEIGLNHNHDLNLAKKMIKAAKDSGADAVKFQTYITEKLIVKNSDSFSLFKNLELSKNDFKEISTYCKTLDINFFSTPFCLECVDWLEELNVSCYKIASMDLNYYELIRYIAMTKKPVILSTGMSNLSLIEKAINTILKVGNEDIILLHTISKYPPKYSDMDLRNIEKLKKLFNYQVGFSDHSPDNLMAVIARTLGATIFEKHFTLDKKLPGPDHSISLEPKDFKDLKEKLKAVDEGLAEHGLKRSDSSIEISARRSLYATKDLKKGTIITLDMIDVLRPGKGISPEFFPLLLGRELLKDIKEGETFDLSCI